MRQRIRLEPRLTDDELRDRYRRAADPVERSHWHFLWLLAGGTTATALAAVTGYSAYWIGHIGRRYYADGPDGMRDRRHTECAGRPRLPASQLAELATGVADPHPDGDRWCGRSVATLLSERLGRHVRRHLGWRSLRRLGARWLMHLYFYMRTPLVPHPRRRPLWPGRAFRRELDCRLPRVSAVKSKYPSATAASCAGRPAHGLRNEVETGKEQRYNKSKDA